MSKVLFLCTGNSARSQMAEGWLRHLAGNDFEAFSAGTHPSTLHPLAITVMREVGIDISRQSSKHLDRFLQQPMDYVITVCGAASAECPYFPASFQVFRWSFDDPAAVTGSDTDRLNVFRRVRDEIRDKIENEFLCLCNDKEI